jgi:SAM-dependent methyltransferase
MRSHRDRIVDQFTRQAIPFSSAPGIRDVASLQLLIATSGVSSSDKVLDVACGPGLVVRAFAGVAAHVTGIDVTPAMIVRARELVGGLENVALEIGDVSPLPYGDQAFDVVVCRFAFHHFQQPDEILREMCRVCRRGGCVMVCDLLGSEDPRQADAFQRVELQRDPSHVRAHRLAELEGFFAAAGLIAEVAAIYQLPFELESLLARSFPSCDAAALRQAYIAALDDDALGLHLARVGNEIHGAYNVAIVRAIRA